MRNRIMLGLGLISALALSACGDNEEMYSKEEVEKLVNEAVKEATLAPENGEINEEEENTSDSKEENVDFPTTTDTNTQEGPIRGAFNKYENLPVSDEEQYTIDDQGLKLYEMNSKVSHDNFEFYVSEFEVVKYLESNFTSNIIRSEEGKSYIMVFITGQNIGDRATTISDNGFNENLLITNKNGEFVESYGSKDISRLYLEQYGSQEQDTFETIERLGYFSYLVGYEVDDKYLDNGNILWLSQGRSTRYDGQRYKIPFYEITSDFKLPVVKDEYNIE